MTRLAIFVCYDKQGIIDNYIPYMLNDLKKNIKDLVIIANGKLTAESRDKLTAIASNVVCRENKGFDAGAWKYALTEYIGWEKLAAYDEIVLLNDTFFGPFYPFEKIFEKMAGKDVDFWGLTQHGKVAYDAYQCNPYGFWPPHIQSYFICIRKKMHISQEFKEYWENMPLFKSWEEAVGMHETYFTKHFEDKGFKWDSYIHNEDKTFSYNPYGYNTYEILTQGYPVIKRKEFALSLKFTLTFNNGEDYRRSLEWIKNNTTYDTRLIFQNILRNYNISDIHDALHLDYIIPDSFLEKPEVKIEGTCVVLHIYYADRIERYIPFILNIPDEIDILITTTSEDKKSEILKRLSDSLGKRLTVLVSKNRGRDVAGLLVAARPYIQKYKYLCFCHDKASKQTVYTIGNSFERILWDNTLKSRDYILNIISKLQDDENLGLLVIPSPASSNNDYNFRTYFWGPNFNNTKQLLDSLNISVPISKKKICLTIGTAFWCKTKALAPLLSHDWKYEDFPEEPLPIDGTISHAVERSFSFVAQSQGFYTGIAMTPEWASVLENDYKYYFLNYYPNYTPDYSDTDLIARRIGVKNSFRILKRAIHILLWKITKSRKL